MRMATSQFGKLTEFVPEQEDWTQYIERLEQFFLANDADPDWVQDVGGNHEGTLWLNPLSHFYSVLSIAIRQPGETVSTYVSEICSLAEFAVLRHS